MKQIIGIKQKYDNIIRYIEVEEQYEESEPLVVEDKYAAFIYFVQNPKIKYNRSVDRIMDINSVRKAEREDIDKYHELQKTSNKYKKVFINIVNKRKLPIVVISAVISLDNKTIKIIFSSDFKIKYNEIIQDFLNTTRRKYKIELYQLNSRDYKLYEGGVGVCGYELCCHKLKYIKPLIKENDMSLLIKFYGLKGSLMGACKQSKCCLLFDLDEYKKYAKILPKVGKTVIYNEQEVVVKSYDFQTMDIFYKYKQRMKKERIEKFLKVLNKE